MRMTSIVLRFAEARTRTIFARTGVASSIEAILCGVEKSLGDSASHRVTNRIVC